MKTWDILTSKSTIASGTAFDHLMNQGGEGGLEKTVFVEQMTSAISDLNLVCSMNDVTLTSTTLIKTLSFSTEDYVLTANIHVY